MNKDDVSGLVERLDAATKDDHERGCQGRYYACSCGYDDSNAQLLQDSKEALTTLSARVEALEAEAKVYKEAGLMALAAIDDHNASHFGTGLGHIGDFMPMVKRGSAVCSLSAARKALAGDTNHG